MPVRAFYTVGHSTRTLEEFIALLRVGEVEQIVDVRAMPRSRTNPQFNGCDLAQTLASSGIAYAYLPALAGLRSRSKIIANEVNGYWRYRSFHNYAGYALSMSFRQGLEQLIQLGAHRTCAVMCSEAVWWRCHRRSIADHLLHRSETVYHLMGNDRIQPAVMTEFACAADDGKLVYPLGDAPVGQ